VGHVVAEGAPFQLGLDEKSLGGRVSLVLPWPSRLANATDVRRVIMQGLKARFHFFQALGQIRGVADLASTGQGQKRKKHIRLDHKQNWLGRNNMSWGTGVRELCICSAEYLERQHWLCGQLGKHTCAAVCVWDRILSEWHFIDCPPQSRIFPS